MQMAIERQETGVDAWFRAWAVRDYTALAAMYHPDAVYERPDGTSRGAVEIVAYLRALATAAPQTTATVEAAHFAAEAVTVEWTEHQPDGDGSDRVVDVFRVHNGRIVSQRQYLDPSRRLRHLAAFATHPPKSGLELNAAMADPGATIVAGQPPSPALQAAAATVRSQPSNWPALQIDSGPDRGLLFPISEDTFSIGRALDNGLVLRDPATSLHHAQIECRAGELVVADLESTNGTYVNGERIRQRPLVNGDRLGIGQNGLLVIAPAPAAG
jgi:ketosteroid isomerase-like protein